MKITKKTLRQLKPLLQSIPRFHLVMVVLSKFSICTGCGQRHKHVLLIKHKADCPFQAFIQARELLGKILDDVK